MYKFERILCPVDLSGASLHPLAYAGAIAAWDGGQVTVFHAVPAPSEADGSEARLRRTVSEAGLVGPHVTLATDKGEPATAIVAKATATHADLVIMGTHGPSPFDPQLLGSVTAKVLRKAPCPVLTVPPHAPGTARLPVRRILCAIDFSPSSVKSFRHAADLGIRAGAPVMVVHSIEWFPEQPPSEMPDAVADMRERLIEDSYRQLADIVSYQTPGVCDVKTTVAVGRAHREILRIAEQEEADLIVMGAQGRAGTALAMFGSTTQQVVARASCAVLTIR